MVAAAAAGWFSALAQCSTRMPAVQHGVLLVRDVADGDDGAVELVRRTSSTSIAVVDLEPGRLGELDVRADADADDHGVGGDDGAVAERGRRSPDRRSW